MGDKGMELRGAHVGAPVRVREGTGRGRQELDDLNQYADPIEILMRKLLKLK